MTACFFAQFAPTACEWRPDGLPDRAHLIPKQRLRNAGLNEGDIWDRRVYVLSCRAHHHAFDSGFLRLRYSDYPWPLHQFARDHGFFYTDRGWRHESPVEAA